MLPAPMIPIFTFDSSPMVAAHSTSERLNVQRQRGLGSFPGVPIFLSSGFWGLLNADSRQSRARFALPGLCRPP